MFFERAGHYIRQWDESVSIHDYHTFIPTPICDIDIKPDDELIALLSGAQKLLGLLEGSCRHIGNVENITALMIKKEATSSCLIDDELKFSYLDLFIEPKYRPERVAPVKNHITALEYGRNELKRIHLTNKIIRSAHGVLMGHRRGAVRIGIERTGQIIFGNYYVIGGGMPKYNPPAPEDIALCMNDMQRYIKREDAIDALIKTALLHYQLEAVHPFESGNGKIGRILIALYLFEKNVLRHTLLPISEFLQTHKVEYFDRIRAVHDFGKYEQWVKFFLQVLAATADTTIKRTEKALRLRERNMELIHAESKDAKYLPKAYWYIEKHVFSDVTSLAGDLGISYNTAARVVRTLVNLGILKVLKEQMRNRIYFYAGFLEALGFPHIY
jgi:Fic family protein